MNASHVLIMALAVGCVPLAIRLIMQGQMIDAVGVPDTAIYKVQQAGLESEPAWRTYGQATASVNWCEEDHAVTWLVAEFWNVLSSFAIVFYGAWGLWAHREILVDAHTGGDEINRSCVVGLEERFKWAFVLFFVVGIGSVAFHATLWRSMQLLDELPMMWGNAIFIYILRTMEDKPEAGARRREAIVLGVSSVLMTYAVVFLDQKSQDVFLICYASGVAYIVIRTVVIQNKLESQRKQRLMETAVCFYFGGLFFWLLDRNFCATVRPFNFHALWHIGAGTGTFTVVILWIFLRHKVLGRRPLLRGLTPMTRWVEISKVDV